MATGTTAQKTVDVVTPAAGESVSEGTILEWHAKVGDFIKAADTIVEISTDKVDVELPAPASGTVVEILVDEGETVTVGQVIARIALNGAGDGSQSTAAAAQAREPQAPPRPEPAPGPASEGNGSGRQAPAQAPPAAGDSPAGKVSPVAARAAEVEGVDLAGVSGSGP